MESWAEKYRPESLSDIIGNTKVINDLKTWAKSWGDKMVKKWWKNSEKMVFDSPNRHGQKVMKNCV